MEKINEVQSSIGVFSVISGVDADNAIIKPTKMVIDKLMPKEVCGIIAGTTGSNKSFLVMQMGMSIANDEDSFLGFDIKEKGLSVLLVDTEIGENLLKERYQMIQKNFDWNEGSERFNMISRVGSNIDIWPELEKYIKKFKPDVVIIDCLYNSISIKDITKSINIFPFTEKLTEIRKRYNLTLFCVHHMNKGANELGLNKDRMSGASALQNWVEHLVLMTTTNEDDTRLMKIVKSRVIDYPNCYYGLDWDTRKFFLTNKGVIDNWKRYMDSEEKIIRYKEALSTIPEKFRTRDWITHVVDKMKMSERTAYGWLLEMERSNLLKKDSHGKWSKNLKFVESE